jgi:eukaryotic-like serine/threonine-protein kinase
MVTSKGKDATKATAPARAPRPAAEPPQPSAKRVEPPPPPAAVIEVRKKDEPFVAVPGVVLGGKYKFERPLRKGAMGSVWLAEHLDLKIPVAVKLLALQTDLEDGSAIPADPSDSSPSNARGSARHRFEREARAAAQLKNANVVRVLDYGVSQDTPYMVMEMLDGEDLAGRLRRVKTLSMAEVARILVPVARALQVAHDAGLVHRDLKPGNIFLAQEGGDEIPKILDFGVARSSRSLEKANEEDLTVDGMVVGTPAYMSPEQVKGEKDLDHRADLWSLGVIAYLALTGAKPFVGPGAMEMFFQICHNDVRPPSETNPRLPPEVDAILGRALQRDRHLRYQSAREFARALAPFVSAAMSIPPPRRSGDSAAGTDESGTASATVQPVRGAGQSNRKVAAGAGILAGVIFVGLAIWGGLRWSQSDGREAVASSASAPSPTTVASSAPAASSTTAPAESVSSTQVQTASASVAPPATHATSQPASQVVAKPPAKTTKRRELGY